MKTKRLIFTLAVVFLILINNRIISQVVHSQFRTPVTRIQQREPKLHKVCILSSEEIKNMLKQDSIEAKMGDYPFRFGKNIDVDIDFIQESTLIRKGDTTLYTYEIRSPSAYSINLIFDQFELNNHSSLYIYNNEGDFVYGPVTSVNNPSNGIFWTDIIKGDHIVIELVELNNYSEKNHLHISSVIHGYKNVFAIPLYYGDSWSCNIDIACYQGNNWRVEGNAVAMLILADGTRICSGSLINNTANDYKGYLLTAFHCLDIGASNCSLTDDEKAAPNNWLFRLHYESPSCGGVEGTDYITINGANFRAAYQSTDFALLELMSTPLFATYSGWQRSTTVATSGVGIHHPAGDVKKISVENNSLVSNASTIYWVGGCTSPPNTHWRVIFDQGAIQGGSSGSPFLNQNHRIVGQLHGGWPSCAPTTMYYGRFDKSWTGGGTNATRLSNWLDPTSSGVTYLNTKYTISSTLSGSFVICLSSSSSYTVNNLPSNSSVYWQNSTNLTRVSAQGSNPCNFSANSNGSGWIRVRIKSNTDNSYVTLPQFPIWVGKFESTVVTGTAAVCPNSVYSYTAQVPGGHDPSYSYSWTYPSNWYNYGQNQNSIILQTPSSPYYGPVRVSITNQCGTSGYSGITTYPGYNCGGYYSMYPNPASDEVTIKINEPETIIMEDVDVSEVTVSKAITADQITYTIRIYNSLGTLVSSAIRTGTSFDIPLPKLRDGTYIVELSDGKNSYREQLIIKHE